MNVEEPPASGQIVIEWVVGHDPSDYDTYDWKVTCDPKIRTNS